jgi:hypothetical protein
MAARQAPRRRPVSSALRNLRSSLRCGEISQPRLFCGRIAVEIISPFRNRRFSAIYRGLRPRDPVDGGLQSWQGPRFESKWRSNDECG